MYEIDVLEEVDFKNDPGIIIRYKSPKNIINKDVVLSVIKEAKRELNKSTNNDYNKGIKFLLKKLEEIIKEEEVNE